MSRHKLNSLRKFEKLEDRRMMVGDIDFDDGVLTITGGGLDDQVEVRFEGDQVRVDLFAGESDGTPDHHDRDEDISDVERIVFNGFAGNDTLTVFVDNLDAGVSLDNVVLEFNGGNNDDDLIQNGSGVRTVASGGAGNDELQGSLFDDTLEGGIGNDVFRGRAGDDTYVFSGTGLGIDEIRDEAANADVDTLDYSGLGHIINVDLEKTFTGSNPENAMLFAGTALRLFNNTAIENVISSDFGGMMRGNSRDNHFVGGDGRDTMAGRGGNDLLEGGAGSDTYEFNGGNLGFDEIIEAANADRDELSFNQFATGVTVDLARFGSDLAVDSADLRLRLSNDAAIEDVFGSPFSDTILGNSRDNRLFGKNGIDRINGRGGADTLNGGASIDFITTDVLDVAYGGTSRDYFDGVREDPAVANPRPNRYLDWGLL
jgi:Ca2+-binding RTX toxin-like protein